MPDNLSSPGRQRENLSHGKPDDVGLLAWTEDPRLAGTSTSAPASGTIWAARLIAQGSGVAGKLWFNITVAGSTLTAGQNLIALYRNAGSAFSAGNGNGNACRIIGTCPDQTVPWATAGLQSPALTVVAGETLTVSQGDILWIAMLNVGTTPPTWRTFATQTIQGNFALGATDLIAGRISTGQTALPTVFDATALVNSATTPWGIPSLGVSV